MENQLHHDCTTTPVGLFNHNNIKYSVEGQNEFFGNEKIIIFDKQSKNCSLYLI